MAEMDRLISRFGPKSVHNAHIRQLNGLFWLRSLASLSIPAFFALFTSGCAKYGRYGQPEGSASARARAGASAGAGTGASASGASGRASAGTGASAGTRAHTQARAQAHTQARARGAIYCHSLTSGSRCTPASSMTRSCTSAIRASTSAAVAPPVFTTKPACLVDTCAPPTDVPCKPAS